MSDIGRVKGCVMYMTFVPSFRAAMIPPEPNRRLMMVEQQRPTDFGRSGVWRRSWNSLFGVIESW